MYLPQGTTLLPHFSSHIYRTLDYRVQITYKKGGNQVIAHAREVIQETRFNQTYVLIHLN